MRGRVHVARRAQHMHVVDVVVHANVVVDVAVHAKVHTPVVRGKEPELQLLEVVAKALELQLGPAHAEKP